MNKYQEAIESTNIVSKTDVDGIITFVNDEFCKISGYTKKELIGQNHNIVRHPDADASKFKALWDTINAKKIYKDTVKNLAKNGSTFYVNTTVIPILDESEEIKEFIAIRYDVTQEMLYKQQVQDEIAKNKIKQKAMLTQARHASLGQMLANIAHQWRQPLTELNLTVYNMKRSVGDLAKIDEYFSQSKDIIKSMSNTINDFTNFFTPDREVKSFNVCESISEAVKLLDERLGKSMIEITLELEDAQVLGVQNEITQVLVNLLNNSADAFEQKGVLLRQVDIKTKCDDENVHVIVTDNAGGIEKKIIDKIFDPYFTTKHQRSGTGLGLFMSKMICEQGMGGTLGVKSLKSNTTFTIDLPLDLT